MHKFIQNLFVALFITAIPSLAHAAFLGVKTVHYQDTTNPRPLVADIYYPTNESEGAERPMSPMMMAERIRNASLAPSTQPYPLIILSHGYGGSREHLSWLAEGLSQQGFIVAALDHFGNTSTFDTPRIALQRWLRPHDVTAFLDHFLKDPQWKNHIDSDRIGFAGFSLGGLTGVWLAGGVADQFEKPVIGKSSLYELARFATTADIDSIDYTQAKQSYKDSRIKASFLMAPAHGQSFSAIGLSSVDIPVLIIAVEKDMITPLTTNAAHYQAHIANAEIYVFKGPLSHLAFRNSIDPAKASCADPHEFQIEHGDDVQSLHQSTLKKATLFFKEKLKL